MDSWGLWTKTPTLENGWQNTATSLTVGRYHNCLLSVDQFIVCSINVVLIASAGEGGTMGSWGSPYHRGKHPLQPGVLPAKHRKQGWWWSRTDKTRFYACPNPEVCLTNSTCVEGYDGPTCAWCIHGYSMNSGY